ncbi:hypothetical protein RTBOTA2_003229 [Rhodotorula toruloides]|nr:hypothetical protein RTBOTA2_003229 [Rhodotorula toruloides]
MARNSTSKGPRSSSPSKSSSTGGDNPGLSAWREFYAREAPKIKAENPNMKGKMVQKRVSTLYRKWKEENGNSNE